MKRVIVLFFHISFFILPISAQEQKKDTLNPDTTLQGVKMKEVIVTKDRRLPIFVNPQTGPNVPHVKSFGEIIGRKATDMIMHPFAVKRRKEERRRKKIDKKLWEYDHIKTDNELLREALIKEGIDPDSLLHLRDSVIQKETK